MLVRLKAFLIWKEDAERDEDTVHSEMLALVRLEEGDVDKSIDDSENNKFITEESFMG